LGTNHVQPSLVRQPQKLPVRVPARPAKGREVNPARAVVKSGARRAIHMARQRVPKGQIVLKKDDKLKAVEAALPKGASAEDMAAKFKELYPNDWDNIGKRYRAHERLTKPGKSHPMPQPDTYLLNMVKTYMRK